MKTEAQRKSNRKYMASPKGRISFRKAFERWSRTPHGKLVILAGRRRAYLRRTGMPADLATKVVTEFYSKKRHHHAISGTLMSRQRLVIDHDHRTGKFRGFITREQNSILGFAHDNPKELRQLAAYLESRQE